MYNVFKKIAFAIDPEVAHVQAMNMLSKFPLILSEVFKCPEHVKRHSVQVGRLRWRFPVGLAAGLDKNAEAIDFFSRINFGAVEVGTVTPLPQEGNSKPRMFRYPKEESLRNRMGFNNAGAEDVYQNILASNRNGRLLGVNLGKNKVTPQEKAPDDYRILYKKFAPVADYLVVNVSSPNTPGLRDLQKVDSLKEIFIALADLRSDVDKPLYLKISPDLAIEDLSGVIELVKEFELEGIIATNTTVMSERGEGGISGKLLSQKAAIMRNEALKHLKEVPDIQLIGVGGISEFNDLWDFWKAGGRATQIYTSFIYQGPGILKSFTKEIESILRANQLNSVDELLNNISHVKRL